MPTFNQLVRKGRQTTVKKSTAPALQRSFNSLQKKPIMLFLSRLFLFALLNTLIEPGEGTYHCGIV